MRRDSNIWLLEGQEEHLSNLESLSKDLVDYSFMYGRLTYEMKEAIYRKHNQEMPPQVCKVGKYVITNHGMMYKMHNRYFELLSNPDDISETPIEYEIKEIREVTSFDF